MVHWGYEQERDCQKWRCPAAAQVHAEKARAAEDHIRTDVVQVVWHYGTVLEEVVERLAEKGFAIWGAPGRDPEQVRAWRDALIRHGAQGFLLTRWIPCVPANRENIRGLIRTNGPCAPPGEPTAVHSGRRRIMRLRLVMRWSMAVILVAP